MKTTFEEYLQQVCPYGLTLDDDMPDFYDKWVSKLNAEEVMKLAESFGTRQYIVGGIDSIKGTKAIIYNMK